MRCPNCKQDVPPTLYCINCASKLPENGVIVPSEKSENNLVNPTVSTGHRRQVVLGAYTGKEGEPR